MRLRRTSHDKKILLIFVVILAVAGGILFFSPTKAEDSQRIFTSKEISDLKKISLNGDFDVNITSSDSKDIKCSFSEVKKGFVFGTYNFEVSIENNVLNVTSVSMKNRSDGLKVSEEYKKLLKDFWESSGDGKEYIIKIIF